MHPCILNVVVHRAGRVLATMQYVARDSFDARFNVRRTYY